MRKGVIDANPKVAEVLNRISALLDETAMAAMNYQVDAEKRIGGSTVHGVGGRPQWWTARSARDRRIRVLNRLAPSCEDFQRPFRFLT